jgi:hypothetical protein
MANFRLSALDGILRAIPSVGPIVSFALGMTRSARGAKRNTRRKQITSALPGQMVLPLPPRVDLANRFLM